MSMTTLVSTLIISISFHLSCCMAPLVPLESEDQCHLAVAPPLGSSTWIWDRLMMGQMLDTEGENEGEND